MPPTRFAFAADLHMQPGAWAGHPTLTGDAGCSFSQIISRCLDLGIAELYIGGDVFDKQRPDPDTVLAFGEACRVAAANGLAVSFIQGDHDYWPTRNWRTPWAGLLSGGARWVHGRTVDTGMGGLYGLDYQPPGLLRDALVGVPGDARFLLAHQSWKQLMGFDHVDGDAADVPGHVEYLLTGDYHVPEIVLVCRDDTPDNLTVVSPGSTCMQAINERPDKSFVIARENGGSVELTREPLQTRHVARWEVADRRDLDALLTEQAREQVLRAAEGLPPAIEKPIVQVTYRDDIPDAVRLVTEWAAGWAFLFLTPRPAVDEVDIPVGAGTADGVFATLLSAARRMAPDENTYDRAARLLRAAAAGADLESETDGILEQAVGGG